MAKGEKIWVQARPNYNLVQAAHRHNPYGKRERVRASRDPQYGTRKSYGGRQGPVRGQAETLTPVGRDPHPQGRQPGHQGERASVKETSHTQRLQPVH